MTKAKAIKLCVDGEKITHDELEGYIYFSVDGKFYRVYPDGHIHIYSFNNINFLTGFKILEARNGKGTKN